MAWHEEVLKCLEDHVEEGLDLLYIAKRGKTYTNKV